jgi:hypothetical protein
LAGGVDGIGVSQKRRGDVEFGGLPKAGDDGESCDTNASALGEKTNPLFCSARVTVRRDRDGTSM